MNELATYSRSIEIKMMGNVPFISAHIGNEYFTKCHIYIIQVSEHKYSMCHHHDDLHGNRYIPTLDKDNPFIKEKRIIQNKFQYKDSIDDIEDDEESILLNVGYLSLLDKLYDILFKYNVIKINPKTFDTKIEDLEILIRYPKLITQLNIIFKNKKINNPTLKDLISIVKNPNNSFNMRIMKKNYINIFESKLKEIGINMVIRKNAIMDINFDKAD